ncbi:MAG: hypothetical protein QNK36_11505 [Colwellia sp.]|nr:hypothetical protein [Colwellia sp.]
MLLPSVNSHAADDLIIVANIDEKDLTLTKVQVKNLFMRRAFKYELEPVILPPEHIIRILFNTKIVGLRESRIQSYWAQMRFSGRKVEPMHISTERLIIEYLLKNKGSIAYLSGNTIVPENLTIVYATD